MDFERASLMPTHTRPENRPDFRPLIPRYNPNAWMDLQPFFTITSDGADPYPAPRHYQDDPSQESEE